MKKPIIFTVGHSTHPIGEFIQLLQAHQIRAVVDIRKMPKSRHSPQFNEGDLKESLRGANIQYKHIKKLGGLRHATKESTNLGWRNASFRGFADYMLTPGFSEGMEALIQVANDRSSAIMCAEAVPWRCHRSLIADALTKRGWLVRNIMSRSSATNHRLTPFLKIRKGQLTYPGPKA